MEHVDIAIVGGGLAAAAAAENYRKAGGTGSVALFSQESDLPVHRPPLSKEYLRGEEAREKVFVQPADFYSDQQIAVHLDTRIDGVNLDAKLLHLAGGEDVPFGTLVIATGARPRRLPVPGADLPGVFYLRSLTSAEQLMQAAATADRAVIIGAGFIGAEVAATLTQRGIACTVVEMAPRMWARLVPPVVAEFIQGYFEARGVSFRFGTGVTALQGTGRLESVLLTDGTSLAADLVVAGVGVALNTQLAEQAGLPVDGGIVVDEYFTTSHPDIYAIGDVASIPDPIGGRRHLEHWDNALNQGRSLGKALAGQREPFDHVAYFFSDLFDLSLNMIGYPEGWDDIIVRGDPAGVAFTTIYLRDGVVRAALMINDDRHFDAWPALIKARQPVAGIADRLADPTVDPASLLTERSLTLA
jgi:3-phenylpropionate/trans-cinnamate dioxygenase ferredoxin reductase subunit